MRKIKSNDGRIRRDISVINIIYTIIAVLINIMMGWSIYSITQYSSLSKWLFILINIFVLLLMLSMNFLLFMLIRTRKIRFMKIVSGVLVIFLLVSSFTTFLTTKVNITVNKITNSSSVKEDVETSIVVYGDHGNYIIEDIAGLNGKTVGIVDETNYATMAKEELETNAINASYTLFNDYSTLAQALFNGEVDAAALPSNYVGLLEINEGFTEYLDNTKAVSTFSKVIKIETETGSTKDITTEPFTVLIIGVDEGRSDAMMIASFNPISMRVTLSSVARDSYVPIACYSGKSSDKLGHARVRSRQCTIDTIEELLDIDIDYYFESNFQGVIDMVDALGGIVVNNPIEFVGQNSSKQRGHFTVWVPAGENVPLNGEQALAFARERKKYLTGDFQRQANQQQVIEAILRKIVRLNDVNKGIAMLDAAGKNVSTNMTVDQLIALFNYSLQKTSRYYDKEHAEDVFNIVGSRVTGYGSSIWNEGLQLTLSIYMLFDGALKDTNAAITRNIDMTSAFTAPKSVKWNANWVFTAPVIANEAYAEEVIKHEVPDTLPKFTNLSKLQLWANTFGITVNPTLITEGMEGYNENLADGTIIWQDVATGTAASQFTTINVNVISRESKPVTACPVNSKGTYPNCDCSANTDGMTQYDTKTNTCVAPSAGKEHNLTVRYVIEGGEVSAPATATSKVAEGVTYSVTSPTVAGFTPNSATVTGTMGTSDIDLTVTYKKNTSTVTQHTLTIKYQLEGGGAAPNTYSQKLDEGASYSVLSPSVTGYTADKTTVAGTMGKADVTVTVTYKKDATSHAHDENGSVEILITATCTSVGKQKINCSANDGFVEREISIDSNNHAYNESGRDESTCLITYTCAHNSAHTKIENINGCVIPQPPAGESNVPEASNFSSYKNMNFYNFAKFSVYVQKIATNLLVVK